MKNLYVTSYQPVNLDQSPIPTSINERRNNSSPLIRLIQEYYVNCRPQCLWDSKCSVHRGHYFYDYTLKVINFIPVFRAYSFSLSSAPFRELRALLHKLYFIIITKGREASITENMNPIGLDFWQAHSSPQTDLFCLLLAEWGFFSPFKRNTVDNICDMWYMVQRLTWKIISCVLHEKEICPTVC